MMKILFAHTNYAPWVGKWYEEITAAADGNLEIKPFCVTLSPPGPRLTWMELDRRWKQKDKLLMGMYTRLLEAASDCDFLLHYNGANIHPEFLSHLPTFNVFCCFDDPESSSELSKPAAAAFDAVFYGNISSRFQYEAYGCKKLAWLPVFTSPSEVPSKEEGALILSRKRDIDVCLVCDNNDYRHQRLDRLSKAFPEAACFGNGWPDGRIDDVKMREIYFRSKIGWNVHNSTGPINRRLFSLLAHGVFQICDNKTGLSQILQLGDEAVGFDTIPQAIELTHHYLQNDDERRRISVNGYNRYWQDYHATAIWQRIAKQLDEWKKNTTFRQSSLELPRSSALDAAKWYGKASLLRLSKFGQRARNAVREVSGRKKPTPADEFDEKFYLEDQVVPYIENSEMKGINMAATRLQTGQPFEWPNMLALNWAVTSLIRNAKQIVEIGSGTGPFAEYSSFDRTRIIHCFEDDDFARTWAEKNRNHPNVIYKKLYGSALDSTYDLLVTVDVIEHVHNIHDFLTLCSSLAPRAIFTTPNREVIRGHGDMGPPEYPAHVREFSTGEFYWILKQHYEVVWLYHMPDPYIPYLKPMTILTKGTPIIAECITSGTADRKCRQIL
jgi:spore maturation protein CgeB